MKALTLASLALFAILLCISCGGSGGSGSINSGPTAKLRVMNDFVDVANVTANVSGTTILSSQPFGFTSLFTKFDAGSQTINYFDSSSHTLLATRVVNLQSTDFYNVIGLGSAGKGRHILFFQAGQSQVAGQTQVRIVNADEDAAAVDIYITPLGTKNVNGLTPQLTNVTFADDTVSYNTYSPAGYTIWFTPAGQPATLLGGADETFIANTTITLLLIKTTSGLQLQVLQDSGN
jgi:hypothetical protein